LKNQSYPSPVLSQIRVFEPVKVGVRGMTVCIGAADADEGTGLKFCIPGEGFAAEGIAAMIA